MKVPENSFAQALIVARQWTALSNKVVVLDYKRGIPCLHVSCEAVEGWRGRFERKRRKKPLFPSGFGRRFTHRTKETC